MKLIRINRAEWMRGSGMGKLYDPFSKLKCCIGIACEQLGCPLENMRGIGDVAGLIEEGNAYLVPNEFKMYCFQDKFDYNDEIIGQYEVAEERLGLQDAYETNDNKDITDIEREIKLMTIFRDKLNLDIEFYGESR